MMEFWEKDVPKVYSDFVITRDDEILAVSLIGPEIAIKSYRAKYMDSNFSKSTANFWCKEGKKDTWLTKPALTFKVLPQVKTEQGLQVLMLSENLLWAMNGEDLIVKVYQHLYDLNVPCPTPEEDNFIECMGNVLKAGLETGHLKKCKVMGDYSDKILAYDIDATYLSNFKLESEAIIAEYLDEEISPEEFKEGLNGVADYIERYATDIGDKVGKRVTYLHTPGDYDNSFFEALNRKLFPQQKDITVAASKRLDVSNHVIISGQMGTGKTTIGTAACHYQAQGRPYRTFISCPGHLVEKWAREIHEVIPVVRTYAFLGDKKNRPWQQFYEQWRQSPPRPDFPEYWIVGNEDLRGNYIQKPAYNTKKRRVWDAEFECERNINVAVCPSCGHILECKMKDKAGNDLVITLTPEDFEEHTSQNHKCSQCGEILWEADHERKGYRKVSIANIIRKHIKKGFFDYYIADELHKYKGSTAQGLAFGGVISKVHKTIAMTGTLSDGYANGIYYLIWRMAPKVFKEMGYNHDEESRSKFQREYGFWIKSMREKADSYGKSSRAKSARVTEKPIPGYTINTFPMWLLERTCFLKLIDVSPNLPPKTEYVNVIDMDEDLKTNYYEIQSRLRAEIKEGKGQIASIMLHTLLSYPDLAEGPQVIDVHRPDYDFYYELPQLNKEKLYNKERELKKILEAELKQGRKCIIFSTYSNKRDCLPRISWVASQVPGAKVQVLRSNTVATKKREAWVKDKLNHEGINVLICHPSLVETGLDLLECPTIIWMQSGYIPSVVRQASSRGWRIGQTQAVKVIFLCYAGTLQEECFKLIGSKLNASGILEGNLSNEGLRNFGNEDAGFTNILSLLKKNISVANSNDIFESYKAEVAELLAKKNPTIQDNVRLKTLSEAVKSSNIDFSRLTARQRKKFERDAEQLVLFA